MSAGAGQREFVRCAEAVYPGGDFLKGDEMAGGNRGVGFGDSTGFVGETVLSLLGRLGRLFWRRCARGLDHCRRVGPPGRSVTGEVFAEQDRRWVPAL